MRELEVDQSSQTTSVRVHCSCNQVVQVSDWSQQRMQMSMRCLDIHFAGIILFLLYHLVSTYQHLFFSIFVSNLTDLSTEIYVYIRSQQVQMPDGDRAPRFQFNVQEESIEVTVHRRGNSNGAGS